MSKYQIEMPDGITVEKTCFMCPITSCSFSGRYVHNDKCPLSQAVPVNEQESSGVTMRHGDVEDWKIHKDEFKKWLNRPKEQAVDGGLVEELEAYSRVLHNYHSGHGITATKMADGLDVILSRYNRRKNHGK